MEINIDIVYQILTGRVIGGFTRVRAPGAAVSTSRWQCETQNVSQNQDPDIKHYRDMICPGRRGQREGVQISNYGHTGDQTVIRICKTLCYRILKPGIMCTLGLTVMKYIPDLRASVEIVPRCRLEISTPAILQRNRGQSPLLRENHHNFNFVRKLAIG